MGLVQTDHLLEREDAERADEPLPKVGRMKNTQQPEGKVKEVGPVEHLHIELPQTLTRQPSLVVQHIIIRVRGRHDADWSNLKVAGLPNPAHTTQHLDGFK